MDLLMIYLDMLFNQNVIEKKIIGLYLDDKLNSKNS